ncbi:MAG: beta-ketoacyl-[acyl-carrier-protein] synthase family protein [Gemmataceae bacterium]
MVPNSPVWITGIGTCTALGQGFEEFARNLLAGRSAIDRVQGFPIADHPSQIAGQLLEVPCPPGEDLAAFRSLHRLEQLARVCCQRALEDAGLWQRRSDLRIGLVLGVGAEWLLTWESSGLSDDRPGWEPACASSTLIQRTRDHLELTGPAATVSAACASGNVALAQARTWLRLGWVDVCLAGACDMAVSPMSLAAFGNLRALSRRNDAPRQASRPFDRGRDGFVMSEGGAVFVLERADQAQRRQAQRHAEVAGYGAASDAHHMVIPSPDPGPAVAAMRSALADAGVDPGQVNYVNAHATSTPVGDTAEARVLATVFGEAVHRIPVSSTKGTTGHLLTAAAAVETLACLVAMRHGSVPPTINLDDPDPECALCHVPHTAREQPVRLAVSNSFGFGGSNTCLVLRAA